MNNIEIEHAYRLLDACRPVKWNGWDISFDWSDGYIAKKNHVTVEDFDSLAGLVDLMKEVDGTNPIEGA